jgi:hypothetical protein
MTLYRVWLEPQESWTLGWECSASNPEAAVKKWQSEDVCVEIDWDDMPHGSGIVVTVGEVIPGDDSNNPDTDTCGQIWKVTLWCDVTVKWKVKSSVKFESEKVES